MQTATTSAAASKSSMETFRLAIVGEGPAALAAVKYAVSQKVRVALCWTGIQNCMPELTAAIPPCKDYFPGEEEKDSKTFAELVHDVEKRLGVFAYPPPAPHPLVECFFGEVKLVGRSLFFAADKKIRFRRLIIAPSAYCLQPPLPNSDEVGCLLPSDLAALSVIPPHLAVIGFGAEACVWTQFFRRQGSAVTLFSPHDSLFPEEDPFVAEFVLRILREEGVEVVLDAQEWHLEQVGNRRGVTCRRMADKIKVLADKILLSYPRTPDKNAFVDKTDGQSEHAAETECGLAYYEALKKRNRRLETAGPARGVDFQLPHAAEASARRAVCDALRWFPCWKRKSPIPRWIPTDPPVLQVGFSRPQLIRALVEHKPHFFSLADADLLLPESQRRGWIAMYTRPDGKKLLGAVAATPDAEELLVPLQFLMAYNLPITVLEELALPHPSRLRWLCDQLAG